MLNNSVLFALLASASAALELKAAVDASSALELTAAVDASSALELKSIALTPIEVPCPAGTSPDTEVCYEWV